MNIIHFLEKIPFLELELLERIALPYLICLYLIDVFCTYRLYKRFNEPVWPSFIPFFNWKILFEKCWNLRAFKEHLIIEICGLALPFICEALKGKELIVLILSIVDLIVACLGLKHAYEIGVFTLKSFGYETKKYLWSIFIFDLVLVLAVKGKYQGNLSHGH